MFMRWWKRANTQAAEMSPSLTKRLPSGLVHYRLGWKPGGNQAGLVSGHSAGMGDTLRTVVPWLEYPDPRRLDVRATLRDPYQRLWVRDFKLDTAIPVIALVDASASMGYQGVYDRRQIVENILTVLSRSAYAAGDAFGLVVANERIHPKLKLPPKIHRSAPLWIQKHWPLFKPEGRTAAGLCRCINTLPKRKSLIFVISDFHWPEHLLISLLKGLAHHDVVPLVLRDPAESEYLPDSGFAQLQDMEHSGNVFVWMNPQMRQHMRERAQQHSEWLATLCHHFGVKPYLVNNQFTPHSLTQYFLERL